ncbi:MAG: ThuA domain-containing protein [Oscillospiraceae bacterium]|nr:ThuA domain-containing protein [Oscillospiraceae bacterium]
MGEKQKAMVVWGGWDGHQPELVAKRVERILKEENFEVEVYDNLEAFAQNKERLVNLDLIFPLWTMGNITGEQREAVSRAVASGVGLAGNHGGICDAFRLDTEWQFMCGGNWVSHPGNDKTPYRVNIKNSSSPITFGIKDFDVASEQYYLHVDPAVEVLATTGFPVANGPHIKNRHVDMPVVWTKMWGHGRVFYTSLGHNDDVFDVPEAEELLRRGMLWAAEGKKIALENGTTDPSEFFVHKFV